jgi:hypothetical protein
MGRLDEHHPLDAEDACELPILIQRRVRERVQGRRDGPEPSASFGAVGTSCAQALDTRERAESNSSSVSIPVSTNGHAPSADSDFMTDRSPTPPSIRSLPLRRQASAAEATASRRAGWSYAPLCAQFGGEIVRADREHVDAVDARDGVGVGDALGGLQEDLDDRLRVQRRVRVGGRRRSHAELGHRRDLRPLPTGGKRHARLIVCAQETVSMRGGDDALCAASSSRPIAP